MKMKLKKAWPKKAWVWTIYLPLLTMFLCGVVIGMYYLQSEKIYSSVVSPVKILELQDNKEFFEIWENQSIYDISERNWGNDAKIKDEFCTFFAESNANNFIFSDLYFENRGAEQWGNAFESTEGKKSFCMKIYEFKTSGNFLKASRKKIAKKFTLFSENRNKINFAVDADYGFEKEYNIPKNAGVNLKFTCPTLTISKKGLGNSDIQANYRYYNGRWSNSDIYLNEFETADFEKGLKIIFDSNSPYMEKLSIADLDYEKTVDAINGDEADRLFDEIRNKLKSGCK